MFMRVCVVPDLVPNVLFFIWTNGISVCSLSNPKRFHYAFTVYPVSSGHILTGKGNRPVIMPVIAIRQMKRGAACALLICFYTLWGAAKKAIQKIRIALYHNLLFILFCARNICVVSIVSVNPIFKGFYLLFIIYVPKIIC